MKTFLSFGFLLLAAAVRSAACDLCGCSIPNQHFVPSSGFFLGGSEQFTRFDTLQEDGRRIDNDARQRLDSSITQTFVGYRWTDWFAVQVNVPFIARSWRRTSENGIDEGEVTGLGDVSLLATVTPVNHTRGNFTLIARVTGGVKFPTGDSDRLGEEAEEGHAHGAETTVEETDHHEGGEPEGAHEHAQEMHGPEAPESGVHGHDLALGSGSVDAVAGASVYLQWKRLFFTGQAQYAIRTEGDFDYRYANDFLWDAGPGIELIHRPTHRVAVQFICSGETKGKDEFRGEKAADTAVTTVFLGPRISGSWRERFHANVELDVPVHRANSDLQIVPDYRLRASVGWEF